MVSWHDVQADFEPDGALRDIYVMGADGVVWDRALAFLVTNGTARFTIDGEAAPVPTSASDALKVRPDHSPLLLVDRDGIEYACHFFGADQIELDFMPQAAQGPQQFAALVRFVSGLGRATSRIVVVTHENREDAQIIRYAPATDATEFVIPGSRRTRG